MNAHDEDLRFRLARSVQLGADAPAAGASLTRKNRAAKGIKAAYARVVATRGAKDRYRHTSTPTADAAHTKALEDFCTIVAAALGLEDK